MTSPLDDGRPLLEAVGSSMAPQLRGPQVVHRDAIEKGISATPHPLLRNAMVLAFNEMLQGTSPGFQLLRGATLPPASLSPHFLQSPQRAEPLCACRAEEPAPDAGLARGRATGTPLAPLADLQLGDGHIVLPSGAWSHEHMVSLLAELAQGAIGDELPTPVDINDGERRARAHWAVASAHPGCRTADTLRPPSSPACAPPGTEPRAPRTHPSRVSWPQPHCPCSPTRLCRY